MPTRTPDGEPKTPTPKKCKTPAKPRGAALRGASQFHGNSIHSIMIIANLCALFGLSLAAGMAAIVTHFVTHTK